MDKNRVSFEMFLILLSFTAVGFVESQVSVDQVALFSSWMSKEYSDIWVLFSFFWGGEGGGVECAQKPKFAYGTSLGSISRVFH